MSRASFSQVGRCRTFGALAFVTACAAPRAKPQEPQPVPVATSSAAPVADPLPAGWRTHEDAGRFRVGFPPELRVIPGAELSVGTFGKPLVRLELPANAPLAENTTFHEASLLFSVAEGPRDLAACTTFSDLGRESEFRDPKTVKGVEFASRSFVESTANVHYEARVYRALLRNGCYEAVLGVRTGDREDAPAESVQAFDVAKAFTMLEGVLETVRFSE